MKRRTETQPIREGATVTTADRCHLPQDDVVARQCLRETSEGGVPPLRQRRNSVFVGVAAASLACQLGKLLALTGSGASHSRPITPNRPLGGRTAIDHVIPSRADALADDVLPPPDVSGHGGVAQAQLSPLLQRVNSTPRERSARTSVLPPNCGRSPMASTTSVSCQEPTNQDHLLGWAFAQGAGACGSPPFQHRRTSKAGPLRDGRLHCLGGGRSDE